MKRYFEMPTRERIEESDKVAVTLIDEELRKPKKKYPTIKVERKPLGAWKWPKKK